ncbi:MAG: bifunctional 2-keto-4-hydroxyglutarate aldolase/2-keto-3-deoxy-6-phosphogluconate aldolase [Enterococcus lacertideformus]|uniref:Bifunctional 2-keto-4-hydroxyglutarate aldolase/2-keto-3-deoxy-6-phosphogluconate aldolase n=1 Tax=Enterococcus lacertideformus TaxID=2771493 RepID=A0A931AYS6_9ENTE|nr:bifunctional 2-keto-4-hydroxyglutarate aldolase/2-keto-3-deoxy-6-phosphogluconate aldolase [Enterococcus lacertideformus]
MWKVERLRKLEKAGVVAVVRGSSKKQALNASRAVIEGGMTGIKLTFTVPNAERAIQELVETYQENSSVIIGAGTVLDATTARFAIMAGAEFIVSPCFDLETAKICNLYQIPYLPGCMSINEMKEALKAGVIAVGVGVNLMAPAEVGNFAEVTAIANKYMVNFKKIKE